MAFLYHIRAGGSEPEYWPVSDGPLVAGRGDFVDAYVDDDSLSRSHFLIVHEGGEYVLVDLSSSNGTWVNGERINACRLHAPQIIKAGGSLFYFSLVPISAQSLSGIVPLPQAADLPRPELHAA